MSKANLVRILVVLAVSTMTLLASTTTSKIPQLGSLSPTSTVAGGTAFTLTVNGSNFSSGSTVNWNTTNCSTTGTTCKTTYVSLTQLQLAVPASFFLSCHQPMTTSHCF